MAEWSDVPHGWTYCTLAQLASPGGIQGGPFGTQLHAADYVDDGVPITMPKVIADNRFTEGPFDRISREDAQRLRVHLLQLGDIVFGRKGDLSRRALVRQGNVGWFCGTDCIRLRPDQRRANPEWLSYWLGLPEIHDWLHRFATGSTMPNLNTSVLSELPVRVPPLIEQRAIAGVLGALDDKIESNRRLAQLVDALVRAEFASAVASADSKEVTFGTIATRVSQPANPSALDGATPYIGLEHMPRGCMVLDGWGTTGGLESGKSFFAEGDVLFGKLRPYFRKVGVAPVEGVCSTDILVLRPRCGLGLLAAVAASDELIAYASAAASGTKMPRVSWDYLSQYRVTVPGPSAANALEAVVAPTLERARHSVLENHSLSALRDALLPELLSGRLRVRDAEQVVSGAV